MSSLAKYLLNSGKTVSGSDISESASVAELRSSGVKVEIGEYKENISNYDVIVYTDAVHDNDTQLQKARSFGKKIMSRGQLLYEISKNFKTVIAISGCHGKTTCTSMIAHIFKAADRDFCAHIGGNDLIFSNLYFGGDDYFITEACEYKKNFLLLKPDVAVVLNYRPDHLECYESEDELKKCYLDFASCASVKIGLYRDILFDGLTFGYDKNADYSAHLISATDGKYSFTVFEGEYELGRVALNVYGKHNILNALAAVAVARSMSIPFRHIERGLSQFKGVKRRFERLGDINGAEVIADYAHHPDEILASIRTAKRLTEGRLYIVFQPHTYSRTKLLFKQFVRVLAAQRDLLIYRTYAAREYYDDAGSALTLSQKIKKSRYGEDVRDILNFISDARKGDIILFLGAGDIYDIAEKLVKNQY